MWAFIRRTSILLVLLAGVAPQARGDDNPFGLPAPTQGHPGTIVLHGGGELTDDVFERFIELAGGKEARIILVPSAGYLHSDYENEQQFLRVMHERFSGWVHLASSGNIRSFDFLYTDDPDDADAAAFVRPLETATGVWFCGGLQPRLNYRFVGEFPEQTRFQVALREIVARGGVVGGTSAGMAALPEIMTMYQDRKYAQAPATVVAAHGLGLIQGAIVEQHFDGKSGRLERFTGLLRDSAKLDKLTARPGAGVNMMGLAVEEATALVLQGNRLETIGEASAHVFVKSGGGRTVIWHELPAGETARLDRDASGATVLRREKPQAAPQAAPASPPPASAESSAQTSVQSPPQGSALNAQ